MTVRNPTNPGRLERYVEAIAQPAQRGYVNASLATVEAGSPTSHLTFISVQDRAGDEVSLIDGALWLTAGTWALTASITAARSDTTAAVSQLVGITDDNSPTFGLSCDLHFSAGQPTAGTVLSGTWFFPGDADGLDHIDVYAHSSEVDCTVQAHVFALKLADAPS